MILFLPRKNDPLFAAVVLRFYHSDRAADNSADSQIENRTYGVLVGFLFVPQFHIGALFMTPEVSILLGNVFSYIVSSKGTRSQAQGKDSHLT